MKNLFLILVVACFSLQAIGQTNLDSLWGVWQDEKQPDSNRSDALGQFIFKGFVSSQPDSAIPLAESLVHFGEATENLEAVASGHHYKGLALHNIGEFARALKSYNMALSIRRQLGDDQGAANTLQNIGIAYRGQGDNENALSCYSKALKLNQGIDNTHGIASALNNIGTVYEATGDHEKASEYYLESLDLSERIQAVHLIIKCHINLGVLAYYQSKGKSALVNLNKALKLAEKQDDKRSLAMIFGNLGNTYELLGDTIKALEQQMKSVEISREIGYQSGITVGLLNVGFIQNDLGDKGLALKSCNEGYQVALKTGALINQYHSCVCLYEIYKSLGQSEKALEFHEKINAIEDSLKAEEIAKKLQQMEFQKQVLADSIATAEEARLIEEAHQEELRQKKRTRNIFGGVGFFALLLAGGFYWRWRYVRKSKAELQVEKDRSENLLLNILPEEIAEELKEKGRADARDFEMVSILFTDFKGFTAASEKLSAQDLVSEINTCFEAFDGIMGKYGIEKIKTIGDAYMAAGGLPVPTNDSVKNTVLAALEMQAFISDRKAKLDAEGKPSFEMRVGVHTGPVVAGIVGVKKFQYDIWGDTVNTASRMESSGEVGKVNISEATYELLKDDTQFTFETRGKVEAKGKGEMEMFFVSQKG